MNQLQPTGNTQVAQSLEYEAIEQFRLSCQNFTARLNAGPAQESIGDTADGRAKTVTISHIEMTLDEYFFGLWSTENFKWNTVANEIVGSIELVVIHPATGQPIRRSGAAAIQIMVDATPDAIKQDKQKKNEWALNPMNKKSNALDMGFPKLKAECIKNAAQSLGKLFGRDLNRKPQHVDNFNGLLAQISYDDLVTLYEIKKDALPADQQQYAERILNNRETTSYSKLHRTLKVL